MPRRVLDILIDNFEVDHDVVVRTSARMELGDLSQRLRAAPAGAEGPDLPSAHAVGARRRRRGVRADRRPGLPRPPPVRFVHLGGDVPEGGGRRPARRRDQDHALSHRRRLAAGRPADPGRRTGQAGRGAGRAEGPLRREEQHRLGDPAGVGRHPRRLRAGQPQGPLQAVPGRAQGDRRHPPLRPRRHRQLQPHHLAHLHRPRAVHRRPGHRRRRERGVQHADRLLEQAQLPRAAGRAGRAAHRHPRRSSSARSSTPRPAGRRGIIIKNNAVADLPTIRTLFKASQAGVPIDLIVRGVCCLRPGVPGHQRPHPRAVDRRPPARALAALLLRERRRPRALHRQRRPDGAQPRPPGRGAGAGDRRRSCGRTCARSSWRRCSPTPRGRGCSPPAAATSGRRRPRACRPWTRRRRCSSTTTSGPGTTWRSRPRG